MNMRMSARATGKQRQMQLSLRDVKEFCREDFRCRKERDKEMKKQVSLLQGK
jgi:hypothetical protein